MQEFGSGVGPGPGAGRDTDAAGGSFREVGNAFVEVDVPALDATNHLLVGLDGSGRAGPGAGLAGLAEVVCAKANGCCRDQGHVGGDARESNACTELWADEGAVLAELAEARRDCRRNQEHGVCGWAGKGVGVVALRADPICEGMGGARAAGVLVADVTHADAVGLVRGHLAKALVVVREGEHDDPGLIDAIAFEDVERVHRRDADSVRFMRERERFQVGGELIGGRGIAVLSDGA